MMLLYAVVLGLTELIFSYDICRSFRNSPLSATHTPTIENRRYFILMGSASSYDGCCGLSIRCFHSLEERYRIRRAARIPVRETFKKARRRVPPLGLSLIQQPSS
ncbi:hypothetical protein CDEST_00598 [Colletotrichum destructivum]|uniref:Secreted protein n=1 Tax=Colletotrichum destructivum TaxID=34406 RepID=A0AAX4HXF9_9PEZI|nr:hypothetical protein CDEST_00598 [Colletotrichum destructivum]